MKKTQHPLYRTWINVKRRCYDPSYNGYLNHGDGPRITVDERWWDFYIFVTDMGPRPSRDHQIVRIDKTKGYGPGNCRWATRHEVQRMQVNNVWITIGDQRKILADWARELGVSNPRSINRLRRIKQAASVEVTKQLLGIE